MYGLKQSVIESTNLKDTHSYMNTAEKNKYWERVAIFCKENLINNIETTDIRNMCQEKLLEAAMADIRTK